MFRPLEGDCCVFYSCLGSTLPVQAAGLATARRGQENAGPPAGELSRFVCYDNPRGRLELMPPRSERSGVSKDSPVPSPTLELCCAGCGYGARRRTEPERCPMCGGNAWALGGWQPFAELAPSAETEAQYAMLIEDADAPLGAEQAIADPGVPAGVAAA